MLRRWVYTPIVLILLAGAAVAGYRVMRASLAEEVYRRRLETLAHDYEALRLRFNDAVRRTAVTELLVEDSKLCVIVRTSEGEIRRIPTRLDPSREVHVDYLVVDGRLWIRRIYDDRTPPDQGQVIDPAQASPDWRDDRHAATVGKVIYRPLSEGRWIVSVTGDGSLGLVKRDGDEAAALASAPPVRDYEPIEQQVRAEVDRIGLGEVLRRFLWPE